MKIGIPTTGTNGYDDHVGEHFGRVPTYTIIDIDTSEIKIIKNTSSHMGGQGNPPELLQKENVHTMICQGLGRRAIALFNDYNIDVYIGASGTVREALNQYKDGKLQKATETDACGKHAFRDQHHHNHKN